MASQRTTRVLSFSLAIGTVIACVLLAEMALQIIGKPSAAVSGWRFRGRPSETNQLGFRGQPIRYGSDDFVVVLLGDSQVEGYGCAFEWMPERRLQHYLSDKVRKGSGKVKVFTLGTEGYGQDQQLLVLQEFYRSHRADMVVLWQTPGNDVWNNMFPTHWPTNGWPKPTFTLTNNELSGPTENMGDPVKRTNLKLLALLDRVVPIFDRDGYWEKHLPEPYVPATTHQGPVCDDWQQRYDHDVGYMRNENLQTEKSHLAMSLTPVSKRTQYGLDLTRRLLREIDHTVRKNGGRFVVFNVDASENQAYVRPECGGADEIVRRLNGKYYKTSQTQYRENVKYINEALVSVTIPVTVSAWRRGPDDGHLNEHAVDQVMQDLAGKLRAKLLPLAP